jgi:hypothetical protein
MTVIEGSSTRCKTLADGTLQITVSIEPRDAVRAFTLFGSPGVPMALAALKTAQEPAKEDDRPKGGVLSQWAAMRCNEVLFQRWLAQAYPIEWAHWLNKSARSVAPKIDPTIVAANVIRQLCGIESRAELDNDEVAAEKFNRLVRHPWQKHSIALST